MPRGGKREGAGRKPLLDSEKRQSYSTKLHPDKIKTLRNQKNAAQYLESIIGVEKVLKVKDIGANLILSFDSKEPLVITNGALSFDVLRWIHETDGLKVVYDLDGEWIPLHDSFPYLHYFGDN